MRFGTPVFTLRLIVVLLAERAVWAGKERVGHSLLAGRANKAIGVPRRLERIDHLTFDDLLAAGAHGAERRREAIGAVREIVLAFLDFATVREVFAARVAAQVVRVPGHAKRLEHNVMNLFTTATAGCHLYRKRRSGRGKKVFETEIIRSKSKEKFFGFFLYIHKKKRLNTTKTTDISNLSKFKTQRAR